MRQIFVVVFVACFAAGGRAVHGQEVLSFLEVIKCAGHMDVACVLDKSEEIVAAKHQQFLVEADAATLMTGRKTSSEETPSALMETISSMLSEISEMFFKTGFTGFFRDAKEEKSEDATEVADDGDDDEDENEDETAVADNMKKSDKSRSLKKGASEARGKKKKEKKKKIKAIIKLLILGAVIFAKLTLLLKILAAHLQFKFLAIAAAGLLINAARFYLDLKKGGHPQKVIYYEHAQHQHHYEHDDEYGGHGGGGYWGRAYDEEDKSAQDQAYSKQKPDESSSWF